LSSVIAYVGLGSNLGEPVAHVQQALAQLDAIHQTRLIVASRLYRTAPLGPQDQPDFINAVAGLQTRLAPRNLLDELQRLEAAHGRVREGLRWGPRTLDLDILLYDDLQMDEPDLRIPHPGMAMRAFVLKPLQELAADLIIPGLGSLEALLATCPPWQMEIVNYVP
jgi:2-amino-4-hydroxy-6-hydroxymethyldihydropteridine diphosphokinase